jgi:hypothetical protein
MKPFSPQSPVPGRCEAARLGIRPAPVGSSVPDPPWPLARSATRPGSGRDQLQFRAAKTRQPARAARPLASLRFVGSGIDQYSFAALWNTSEAITAHSLGQLRIEEIRRGHAPDRMREIAGQDKHFISRRPHDLIGLDQPALNLMRAGIGPAGARAWPTKQETGCISSVKTSKEQKLC